LEQRQCLFNQISKSIINFAKQLRIDHPRMGARVIYQKMSAAPACQEWFSLIGRDKVESVLLNNGFRIIKIRAFHKTTRRGEFVFGNLIKDLKISRLNQVWVSDITYYFVVEKGIVAHYYLTFVMDLYSRRVLGYAVSDNLSTESTTLPAIKMALEVRKIVKENQVKGLIFHSDGGGQYIDKNFLKTIRFTGMESSMGKNAYENPNAERLNGIIKNDYLIPWFTESLSLLKISTPRAVKLYNDDRPHSMLKGLSPLQFEQHFKLINEK
jgi:putative transposase